MTAPAPPPAPVAPAPVADIEHRIKWRLVAVGVFLAMMAGLLAMAIVAMVAPAPPIAGLPDDPDALAARELVRGLTPVTGGALRFQSALFAVDSGARALTAADAGRIARAGDLIERARRRHPRDPRLEICAAHVALARRLYGRAETGYRSALYFGDHCPDAHLGLGVTLALEAQVESDVWLARGLTLQAIAQFAAVRPRDEPWLAALYDRAVLLEQVGRGDEARRRAREYLGQDGASSWADRLRRELALTP